MNVENKVVVVTGGARGIGLALAEKFASLGAKLAIVDLEMEVAEKAAKLVNGIAYSVDVTDEAAIVAMIDDVEEQLGPIDLFCSNAGVGFGDEEPWIAGHLDNKVWETCWQIHVMAHVYATRALIPRMIKRGGGYFLNTVSAAGLLNQIGDSAYSTTKHAAIGFAESIAITHGDHNIGVSVLCPQAVATRMIEHADDGLAGTADDGILTPEQVADAVVNGLKEERFLILPHAQVAGYIQFKATNYDKWLGAMQKLRRGFVEQNPNTDCLTHIE